MSDGRCCNEPGRRPPRWQAVHRIGTRCSVDFHSVSPGCCDRKIRTTASDLVRTEMLPQGTPARFQDTGNIWPGRRSPRRFHSRTSIARLDSFRRSGDHRIGTRCSVDFHSVSPGCCDRKIRTTASDSVRTEMLPQGTPARFQDTGNIWPGRRSPRRFHSRTSSLRRSGDPHLQVAPSALLLQAGPSALLS